MTKAKPKPATRPKKAPLATKSKLSSPPLTLFVTRMPLEKVKPNPKNPRSADDPEIPGLMASIKANGLINPIIVRDTGKAYEIVAGHRRYEAHKRLKLPTIDCIVSRAAADEEAAAEISAVENLQRRSLTLLEEAGVVRDLVKGALPIKEIADRLGRTIAWVTRRVRITKLIPEWMKELRKSPVREWAPRMLELVASLDPAGQKTLLERADNWGLDQMDQEDLERIVNDLASKLESAPFDVKAADLVKGTPACGFCPKRASCNPGLFDKVGVPNDAALKIGSIPPGDRCLDPACWDSKVAAQIKRSVETVAAGQNKGDKVLVVSAREGYGRPDKPEKLGESVAMVARHYDTKLTPMKPGEKAPKNARLAVDAATGKPAWLIVKPEEKAAAKLPGEKKTMKQKRAALEARRQAAINDRLIELVDEFHLSNEFKVLGGAVGIEPIAARLVAIFGTDEKGDRRGGGDVDGMKMREQPHEMHSNALIPAVTAWELSNDPAARGMMLWFGVRGVLTTRLHYYKPEGASADEAELISGILGIDLVPLRAKAIEDNPVPKSWPAEPTQGKLIKPAKKKKGGEASAPATPQCRECGCTEENCDRCVRATGEPCSWAEPDLCSRCAKEKEGVA